MNPSSRAESPILTISNRYGSRTLRKPRWVKGKQTNWITKSVVKLNGINELSQFFFRSSIGEKGRDFFTATELSLWTNERRTAGGGEQNTSAWDGGRGRRTPRTRLQRRLTCYRRRRSGPRWWHPLPHPRQRQPLEERHSTGVRRRKNRLSTCSLVISIT